MVRSQSKYLYQNQAASEDYEYLLDELPETAIGLGVDIRGELTFERLLRVVSREREKVDECSLPASRCALATLGSWRKRKARI